LLADQSVATFYKEAQLSLRHHMSVAYYTEANVTIRYDFLLIVTVVSSCTVFDIFDFEEHCNLEIQARGHSMSLKVVLFDSPPMMISC